MGGIPELLIKLKDVPDFYVEMTWEFTSWVPLVSRYNFTPETSPAYVKVNKY